MSLMFIGSMFKHIAFVEKTCRVWNSRQISQMDKHRVCHFLVRLSRL